MVYRPLPADLPAKFRKAGLRVVEIDGWETRGRPVSTGGFNSVGVLNHHTGSSAIGWTPARITTYIRFLFHVGRSDLPAPLCHIALGRDGTVYLGAARRANHAGYARASGSVAAGDGNSLYVGIEWMLSGYEQIPGVMYTAGAVLNAVLLDHVTNTSVQAVSCHFNTSVTGKWDIGDPSGVAYQGHRVLNVPLFREAVTKARKALNPKPVPQVTVLTFQHTSMQHSDTDEQMASDIDGIFSRGAHVLTGTEAGGAKARPMPSLLRAAARKYGYRITVRGQWVAVRKDLITGGWATGYQPVIGASESPRATHTARGIPWATFDTEHLGRVTVGAGHYLTQGRRPGQPNYELNLRYAEEIGKWARAKGKGEAVVFYGGDQNINDRNDDTFFGSPLTSAWDELGRWRSTGPGPSTLDVIASYNGDARVTAKTVRALTDTQFHLHTDHFLVEAEYQIEHV